MTWNGVEQYGIIFSLSDWLFTKKKFSKKRMFIWNDKLMV